MKAEVESISPVKKKLIVEIPPDEVAREEEAALKDIRRKVTIPGFRRGRAPLSVIRRYYGERVLGDVISRLIQESYRETLDREEIVPVSDAEIEIQSVPPEGPLSYTAVVEVRPVVEPREYTGFALKKERVRVEETEVEAELEAIRRQRATYEPAPEDHEAAEGDLVVIDYQGTLDGEPFEGGTGEDRTVLLGSGTLVPGFEEGLLGARTGEERTVDVAFPEDHPNRDVAGRTARFRVTVKEVKVRRLPDLDDEFAREVADVQTLDELRDRIRQGILREKERRAEERFRDHVIDTLLEANPFEVPPTLVRSQQARSMGRFQEDLARRGLSLDALGIEGDRLEEAHRRGAERTVRWAFLVQAIARKEGIEISDQDVEQRIREIAEADGRPYETIRAFFDQEERMRGLRSWLLEKRVLDWVVERSTVEEVEPAGASEEAGHE